MNKKNSQQTTQKVFVLEEKDIALGLSADNKEDAIRQVADYLIANGRVLEEYKAGMLMREDQVSTYLMNGIAIPHGVNEAKQYIKDSGVFIGQFPQGIIWNDNGDMVFLVCALASDSDAHIQVLTQLTMIVQDEKIVQNLISKKTKEDFLKAFAEGENAIIPVEETQVQDIKGLQKSILFVGENGMHARPASVIAKIASEFHDTNIVMHANMKSANAKSMPSMLTLGIAPQTEIIISAEGKDEEIAVNRIIEYIADVVNYEQAYVAEENEMNIYEHITLEKTSSYIEGVKASPGLAVGNIFKLELDEFQLVEKAGDINFELKVLSSARKLAKEQLALLKTEMLAGGLTKESDIVASHIDTIDDEPILEKIQEKIRKGLTAAFSVSSVFEEQAVLLEQLDNPVLQERSSDMKDVRIRLLRIIENKNETQSLPLHEPFILVAKELSPSQTATLNKHPVLGLCTALGGETSHMAILARALGLPALVGMGDELLSLSSNQEVVLDAQGQKLITNPSRELVKKVEKLCMKHEAHHKKEEEEAHLAAITEDGVRIEVMCNIANAEDGKQVKEKGADGVGLFRTEFLFEDAIRKPSIDDQYEALVKVAEEVREGAIIVRVMDIGGDKPVSWLKMPKEDNPFLGIRGIRLLLRNEEVFRDQLSAIYRVAAWQKKQGREVSIKIMFPMIARLSEFRRAKKIALEVQTKLQAPDVALGVMIETPAAALIANHMAAEVDFFSIGTNDLTQYTLAMDRVHPVLTKEADSLHPSVLFLIEKTVQGANEHKKIAGVCGNMAADPVMLTALIALGVRDVSVSPANVPAVKYLIRRIDTEKLKLLHEKITKSGSGTGVRAVCEDYFKQYLVPKLHSE